MTHERIYRLLELVSSIGDDDLPTVIVKEMQEVTELEESLLWEKAILYTVANQRWDHFPRELREQFRDRSEFLKRVFGASGLQRYASVGAFLLSGEAKDTPISIFDCNFGKVVEALGRIKSGKMTEELWVALRDPTISQAEFKRLYYKQQRLNSITPSHLLPAKAMWRD